MAFIFLCMKQVTKQTYRLFWHHIRPYRLRFFAILTAVAIAVSLQLTLPLFLKRFFNTLADSAAIGLESAAGELITILLTILAIDAVVFVLFRASGFGNASLHSYVMRDVLNTCFEYVHQHSHRFFINTFVGSLVRQTSRLVHAIEDMMDKLYWDMIPLVIRLSIILTVIFFNNRLIAGIMLAWIIVYMAINYWYSVFKLQYDTQRAEVNSKTTGYLADTITNNATIKQFAALPFEFKSYKKLTEEWRKINVFSWNLSELSEGFQAFLMMGLNFGVMFAAVHAWKRGLLTIGDFALIQAYLIQLFNQLWGFGRVIRQIYERLADAEEMVEILNTDHEIKDKPQATQLVVTNGAIEFNKVHFAYNETRVVLPKLDLAIAAGEKVGLVGPSGAGKSTIVSLLFRNFDVTSGAICIDGQNIADVTQLSLRGQLSLVPQDPVLFHRTLKENIRYGKRDATDTEVVQAAQLAHCHEFITQLPDQYATLVGERGVKLSGGERQRVAIARAILKNAPILVLDEATSSLDSESELMIQDALDSLMQDKTVLVIAHRLSTLLQMDRIIVVDQGSVVEMGSHTELLNKTNGVYKKLWELQAGGFLAE